MPKPESTINQSLTVRPKVVAVLPPKNGMDSGIRSSLSLWLTNNAMAGWN